MCRVFDRTYLHLHDPYVEHLQASREFRAASGIPRDTENLARRRKRIAQLDGWLAITPPRNEADSLIAEATKNAKSANYAAAADQFRRLYQIFSDYLETDSARLHRMFGLCLIKSGQVTEGVSETLRAVALNNQDADHMRRCIDNFIAARNAAAGWETLNQMPDDAKSSPEIQLRRARLFYIQKRRDELVSLLKVLLRDPGLAPAVREAATMWLDRGLALPISPNAP
jgi:thioredoxin-like negative regulator of GroEL